MFTIVIVFAILTILFLHLSQVLDKPELGYGAYTCLALMFVCFVLSMAISYYNIPDGFEVVTHEYTYTMEDGIRETQKKDYYKCGDSYYERAGQGKSLWIPFAAWDFVEVDLPETAPTVETNAEVSEYQCPNCGKEGTTKYCGDCGTKMAG